MTAYRMILVGWDGGAEAEDALALAEVLRRRGRAEIALGRALSVGQRREGASNHALLAELRRDADAAGAKAEAARASTPAEGLAELAGELGADLIVVGSKGGGPKGMLRAGSTGLELMRRAPCAVALAPAGFRRRYAPGPRIIGVGYDGSPESRAALSLASSLATELAAELRLMSVADGGRDPADLEPEIDAALASLPPGLPAWGAVFGGEPASALAERATTADLVVVGSRGHGAVRRALLGSTSAKLARSLSCPLLVLPRYAVSLREAAA